MKRVFAILIGAALSLGMVGCGSNQLGKQAFKPFAFPIEQYSVNPLSGEIDKDDYAATHRPVAVMINNIKAALPQYGTASADIVYEVVAEGGITRMVALYSDYREVEKIGSVRSARPYYLQLAASHSATLFHYGTSTQAQQLVSSKGLKTVDGMAYSGTAFFLDEVRRKTYSKEHCSFTGTDYIKAGLEKKGYDLTGEISPAFNFCSVLEPPTNITFGKANTITWDFSNYCYDSQLIYNEQTLEYEKQEYGDPQIDQTTGDAISFDNCFILFDKITTIDDEGHMALQLKSGEGFYFTKGTYQPITWKKDNFESAIAYFDTDGNPLKVNIGKSYVAIVSTQNSNTLTIK